MIINTTKENISDMKSLSSGGNDAKIIQFLNGLLSPPERLILDSEYETLVQLAKYDGKKEFVNQIKEAFIAIQEAEIKSI